MSIETDHRCEDCGFEPRHDECLCRDCIQKLEKIAYEKGLEDRSD